MYMSGFNNYKSHDEAMSCFYQVTTPVAVTLSDERHATLTFLQYVPMYEGQAKFIGDKNTKWRNQ